MHKIFLKALTWNSSAAFLYKIILLSHQIFLYSITPKTLYGLQSSLFAIIYIMITITNFGFEETLLPFFSIYCQNKKNFFTMVTQLYWHIIIVSILAIALYLSLLYGSGEFLHNLQSYCNKNITLLITSIFFVENLKKSIIAIMQLAFLNREIAYAQITMLICYIASLWSLYWFYNEITLPIIFMPMLITSCLELFYCIYCILKFYNNIGNETNFANIPFKVLFKERFYNYLNQITKAIYSPNSMTLLFAYLLGFQKAATIKLFTNIITLIYTCISKSIGVTTGATLSSLNPTSIQLIKSLFVDITIRYFKFLSLLTSITICVTWYAWYASYITTAMTFQILLFFSISCLENMSITYEQLFISQKKALSIAMVNLTGLAILIPFLYLFLTCHINQYVFFSTFISVKIISLGIIHFLAYNYWQINLHHKKLYKI